MHLLTRGRVIDFPRQVMVMGIVNINDDSFSGDGTLDQVTALDLARRHLEQGADIIDVGAESARTNRGPIDVEEEVERLRPFIKAFPSLQNHGTAGINPPLLSVNTWRPEVVRQILPLGIDLLNDIGALNITENAKLCAEHGTALLIMHSIGLPKEPHEGEHYDDVVGEVGRFFENKIAAAESVGLSREHTVLDPGIDFAKDRKDNLRLLQNVQAFKKHERPLLIPVSRKTVIGEVLGIENPKERDAGTVSCSVAGILRGASILRVHNVSAATSAIQVIGPLLE